MKITEINRNSKLNGEIIAEFDAGKLLVRLINSYAHETTLEELIYIIACNRLVERSA